jgi:NADP-dependent aldehyde dehydrogenase
VPAQALLDRPELLEEHFGPGTVVAVARDLDELVRLAGALPGSLTATVHAQDGEAAAPVGALAATMAARSGRLVWNGVPTGVTVGHATVHGGPYPATTAPATTSVGTAAVRRFQRPVAYQGWPDAMLPAELRDANPLGIVRLVDGVWTREPVTR